MSFIKKIFLVSLQTYLQFYFYYRSQSTLPLSILWQSVHVLGFSTTPHQGLSHEVSDTIMQVVFAHAAFQVTLAGNYGQENWFILLHKSYFIMTKYNIFWWNGVYYIINIYIWKLFFTFWSWSKSIHNTLLVICYSYSNNNVNMPWHSLFHQGEVVITLFE